MVERESHTHVLTEYPPYYPQHLVAETQLIIAKAVKKFPTLDLILPLCRYVTARLRPVMMRETSGVRPDLVLMHMDELLKYMLIEHFPDADTQFHLRQKILTSNEWLALAKAVAKKCRAPMPEKPREATAPVPSRESIQVNNTAAVYLVSQPAKQAKRRKRKPERRRVEEPVAASPPPEPAADKTATELESATEAAQRVVATPGRRELVKSKIEEVERETGRKVKRSELSLVANYSLRNLQLFQQGKATPDAERAFNRVLDLPPKTIVERLDQKTRID